MKSRREREKRIMEHTARIGFENGFVEGGRYILALLMGLPRPNKVVVNPEVPLGEVQIHVGELSELQTERVEKLGQFLDAVKDTDMRKALAEEGEINPAQRLEQIAQYCTWARNHAEGVGTLEEIGVVLDEVMLRARGEYRGGPE